jgi:Protein of unknown function (DUF3788)
MMLRTGTRVTAADGETLPRIGDRITDKSTPPDDGTVRRWLGPKAFRYWAELRHWIDESYPGVFAPDWLYGGKSRGWSLRYRKTRALCTLVPEHRRFSTVVVMGGAEREKFEERRHVWRPQLVELYDGAKTYTDGKWLTVAISSAHDLRDVTALLIMKRAPPSRV